MLERGAEICSVEIVGKMAIVLKQEHLEELLAAAQQQGETVYRRVDFEVQTSLPRQFGTGGDRTIELRHGLTIGIVNLELNQTTHLERQHESDFPLVSKFCLSSHFRVMTPGVADVKSEYEEKSSCNYLYWLPDLTEFEEWRSHEPIQLVTLCADLDYFRAFTVGSELPVLLQQLLEGKATRFHQSLGKTTQRMKQILRQLLQCPYQGLTRQLYLEGKALELFSLQFAQWSEKGVRSPQVTKFCSDEVARLHQAKEILIDNFSSPPSLMDLARQVGLNDRKLKQGFQQVFGTTVFGYLQNYRMQQARQLLQNSDITIASVAAAIGYRNSEAFSVAFQRQFAISPKAYQLGR